MENLTSPEWYLILCSAESIDFVVVRIIYLLILEQI